MTADAGSLTLREWIDRWIAAHAEAHRAEQAARAELARLYIANNDGHWSGHIAEHRIMAEHATRERAMEAAAQVSGALAMDKRLDSMNEFRDQLRDQAGSFVRREQLDEVRNLINTQREERRGQIEALDTSSDKRFAELRDLISTEREERRRNEGVKRGASETLGWIGLGIGGAVGIAGIALAALK